MSKIKVDVDELIERLQEVRQDEFVIVELDIEESSYDCEMHIRAIGLDDTETTDYGEISEVNDELI